MDGVVLDAEKLYRLFELHMNSRHDEFWEGLRPDGKVAAPAKDPGRSPFVGTYSTAAPRAPTGPRRFYCLEGCLVDGEQAYLEHRDRGHHPVPA